MIEMRRREREGEGGEMRRGEVAEGRRRERRGSVGRRRKERGEERK